MMKYERMEHENIKISVVSRIGQNHVSLSSENQDSFLYGTNTGMNFLAIADGVSSSKYAKRGSTTAVETIKKLCGEIVSGAISSEDVDGIRKYIVQKWKEQFEGDWNDYATTLNFIIVYAARVIIGQIGDGLIVYDVDNNQDFMTDVDDFYSTETFALGEMVLKSTFLIKSIHVDRSLNLIIATDGVGKEVELETCQGLRDYLVKLQRKQEDEEKKELSAWFDILDKKNGDDKTIGILVLEVK